MRTIEHPEFVCLEKRRHLRKNTIWKAAITKIDGSELNSTIKNISVSGMMISNIPGVNSGDKIKIDFRPIVEGVSYNFTVIAVIQYVFISEDQMHAGIEFTKIPQNVREFIRDFTLGKSHSKMNLRRERIQLGQKALKS